MELQKGKGAAAAAASGAAGGGGGAGAGAPGGGRLLLSTSLDAKDELEEGSAYRSYQNLPLMDWSLFVLVWYFPSQVYLLPRNTERLERCMSIVTSMTTGVSEREANDALNAHVCKGPPQHEEICLGLFTLVLTEPAQAQKCYRDLALVSRDGMNIVLNKINQILMEKYLKLQDTCRTQLVWLVRELVKSGVLGADGVCMTFMKQIAGGDVTAKNIWLAESVLDILTEQREWVLKSSILIAMAVYTYLRLIVDHHGTAQLQALRQKEVDFCMSLLRERFMDCLMIGRDLVRLLQNVARIPEFELLWKDIIHNPQALSPQFTGILQLLQSRTSRKFLACRLTPDMETKLLFMTSRVRFGQQKRYQDWFQRQYLSTPDSQSLRCDLIRYICGVVHPSNEVLSSDILPRWAIIGWLLTTCTSNVAASNAKLALFYDWLFFSPDKDSIMNIEPAILVMHHSMKPHPAITATLLDFMCRIIPNFYPPLEGHVRQGVFSSLNHIVEKRVLAHLAPLFDNPKLDKELRAMLREKFPEFCSSPSPPVEVKLEEPVSVEMDNHMSDKDEGCYDNAEAAFSDDEEDLSSRGKKREFRFHPIKETVVEEPVDITPYLDQLDESLRDKVLQLQKGSDTEAQCEVMQEIVDQVLEEDFDSEQLSVLASCLQELFKAHFRGEVLPEEITEESLEESVGKPLYLIFRNLCQMQEDNSSFSLLLDLLSELYQKQPKIGYHLLYYLRASKAAAGKMNLYESFAQATQLGDLHTCLMMDMKACQEDDVRLLCHLTPSIYTEFPDETLRSGELLNMIVAVIDSAQLQELVCHVMMGNLVMFRKDSVLNILKHPEALSCLLLQLRREKPSEEMVKMVLSRPCHPDDQFTTSILRHWCMKHDELLAEHIKSLLIKNNSLPRKRQSLRSSSSKLAQLTLEQILEHLDSLRLNLTNTKQNFFSQTPILQALQHVQASCDEAHKMKFSDLFSLAEEYEDSSTKPPKSRRKAALSSPRSRKNATQPPNAEEESGSSSASEEEDTKPKPTKRKRKGSSAVGSDSD
ncbi:integrator complex subunit 3 isoform X3 [Ailuropoda melanoleuca]|uniref:integrator complex subunit 3 isoform X3 n=1 Tax=Ailuropoda melanoleuca TaxID=9646 RepID=UPI001494A540|nr:integrator complex subunit 3 isoform X3 [Ailuropoda melanoleuca]